MIEFMVIDIIVFSLLCLAYVALAHVWKYGPILTTLWNW